ncbi:MAG: hypothetical protein M3115_01405 [Thermoproteota archaeon]|nr:hypothetical protein [Thermoproteota archaeon]
MAYIQISPAKVDCDDNNNSFHRTQDNLGIEFIIERLLQYNKNTNSSYARFPSPIQQLFDMFYPNSGYV